MRLLKWFGVLLCDLGLWCIDRLDDIEARHPGFSEMAGQAMLGLSVLTAVGGVVVLVVGAVL